MNKKTWQIIIIIIVILLFLLLTGTIKLPFTLIPEVASSGASGIGGGGIL